MSENFDTFRDHFLSLYQSAVADIARQIDSAPRANASIRAGLQRSATSVLPDIAAEIAAQEYGAQHGFGTATTKATPRDLTKWEIGRVCAELAMRFMKARVSGDTAALARLNDEFIAGTCDPAWARTVEEYLGYFGPGGSRKEIPYIRAATIGPKVIEIKADARLALVGDWGTGAQPAIQLLKQISSAEPDILVHLGDIYYSGTPSECQVNFLDPINKVLRAEGRNPNVFTLSGNHDMYCGGVGYYDLLEKLNPAPFVQPASFFCLRSADERWQFLAMDTGLHDYSPMNVSEALTYIEADELEWHCQRIEEFPGRTILLSHHQLFSAYSAIGQPEDGSKRSAVNPRLYEAFQAMAQSGKISAWFWGHEHTLSIYNPFLGLKRGRCLGHGAVPTSTADKIYEPLKDLDQTPSIVSDTQLAMVGGIYAHGYAIVSLGGTSCSAAYYQDINGRNSRIFEEKLD